jgi:hypothetical protein
MPAAPLPSVQLAELMQIFQRLPGFLPALLVSLLWSWSGRAVHAVDLLPDLFSKDEVTATLWELNEQYVRLVRIESGAPQNAHPVALDAIEIEHALASLRLWIEGGETGGPDRPLRE